MVSCVSDIHSDTFVQPYTSNRKTTHNVSILYNCGLTPQQHK